MKKSIAMKWAALLESGEIKQAKGTLRNRANAMCCLGLLCNMHAEANPEFAAKQRYKTEYDGNNAVVPESVMEWSGLISDNGGTGGAVRFHTTKGSFGCLAEANDNGVKFPEIAQLIRRHYKEL